jgi:hypothetical protein
MEKVSSFNPIAHSLAIKNKGHPPKSWRWEIYAAGKSKPVRQSEFFETMSEATRAGNRQNSGPAEQFDQYAAKPTSQRER